MEATEESPLLADISKNTGKVDGSNAVSIQSPPAPFCVLVELIGARDLKLPSKWMKAYSVIQFGSKTIHRTMPATLGNAAHPIWTVRTNSLFSLQISPNDVANNKQLTITIWARRHKSVVQDAVPVNIGRGDIQFFGKARINASYILSNCTENRVEFNLTDELGREYISDGFQTPTLAIRFRAASPDDIQQINLWNQEQHFPLDFLKEAGLIADENGPQLARITTEIEEISAPPVGLGSAIKSSIIQPRGTVRVKPYQRIPQFMTPGELKAETLAPSTNWVEAGSGSIGKIYVEILSAHDLPNVDIGTAVGNETDAFVCAVYEDALVETPVIYDELSPHWLPWTQRAFAFNMIHPASVLYLGVFGFKRNLQALQHVPIGRVEINPGNFQKDTVYTLQYKLFSSSHVQKDRKSRGTVRIRLRVEIPDERAALMATLKPPPQMYVNIKKRKSLLVARYTSRGEYDNEEKFDLKVLLGYIDEVLDEYLRRLLFTLGDSVRSLFFWRGQVQIGPMLLPLYSFLMFCFALTFVERPDLFPALLLLGAAWIMLANMRCRLQHPSQWHRCHSFMHYFRILITGKSSRTFEKVSPRDRWEEIAAYEEARQKRIDEHKMFNERKEATERAIEEIENASVEDKTRVIPVEIIVVLGKIQGLIGGFCRFLRSIDALVTWEESALSFWITLVLLTAGMIALFLPWAFLLRWTGRIAVVVLLGPQNKIIDMIVDKEVTDERKLMKMFGERIQHARLHQEEAEKLKAFRRTLYGKFSTIVPSILWTHHLDRPLNDSEAEIISPENEAPTIDEKEKRFIPGQQLYGLMIPRPEKAWKRNRDTSMQEKQRIDASFLEGKESEAAKTNAYADIEAVLDVEDDVPVEEGVEVLDVYDEEACFVDQDFEPAEREPSPVTKKNNKRVNWKERSTMEESIYDLGVEIMDTFRNEAQFVQKSWRGSVHNFLPQDLQSSSSDESDQEDTNGAAPSPVIQTNVKPISNMTEKQNSPANDNRENVNDLKGLPATKKQDPPLEKNGTKKSSNQEKVNNIGPSSAAKKINIDPSSVVKKISLLINRDEKQNASDDEGQQSINNKTKPSVVEENLPKKQRGKPAREESIYDLGVEITDAFEDEAQFVQKSWRGSSIGRLSDHHLEKSPNDNKQRVADEVMGNMEGNDDMIDIEFGIGTKEYVVDNADIVGGSESSDLGQTNDGDDGRNGLPSIEDFAVSNETSSSKMKEDLEEGELARTRMETLETGPDQKGDDVEVVDDGVEVSINM